jgi:methionyl-tRNA formyltransferase
MADLTILEPDALVVVAYGELLPPAVLDLPSIAAVNLHFSLLPKYRGAAPVQNALLDGASSTGVTSMLMSEGLDEGDVLMQVEVDIRATDDSGSLGERLAVVGGTLIVETLDGLVTGTLTPVRQEDAAATFAPRISDRRIDWDETATRIVNLVRALAPSPGATTTLEEAPLKVLRCEALEEPGHPGVLSRIDPRGPLIGAGQGSVLLLEVAPSGKKRMSGADLCRGLRLQAGERFGA